jgi:hypothetical protein
MVKYQQSSRDNLSVDTVAGITFVVVENRSNLYVLFTDLAAAYYII